MQGLGFQQIPTNITVAPNFVGMGLPMQIWGQFVNLLFQLDWPTQPTCSPVNGGVCILDNLCSSYSSTSLFEYTFKITWPGGNSTYFPLGSFAFEDTNNDQCVLWITYLDPAQP
jgi:hypothetical protein